MSLDVYLNGKPHFEGWHSGIFIRENGAKREISRAEWDARFPGREPAVAISDAGETTQLYSRNITHNLTTMAKAAGIYEPLWRPDEIGITYARDLIEPLAVGYVRLVDEPDEFRKHNPANGWGTYESLVEFVADYLAACIRHPDATVDVWR